MAKRNSTIADFALEAQRRLGRALQHLQSSNGECTDRLAIQRTLFAVESFAGILACTNVAHSAAALRVGLRILLDREIVEAMEGLQRQLSHLTAMNSASADSRPEPPWTAPASRSQLPAATP